MASEKSTKEPFEPTVTILEKEWDDFGRYILALGDALRLGEDAESGFLLAESVLKEMGRHYNRISNRLAGIEG